MLRSPNPFRPQPIAATAPRSIGSIAAPPTKFRRPGLTTNLPVPQHIPFIRFAGRERRVPDRSEEHTSELQSLMRISYAVFCLKKKTNHKNTKLKQVLQTLIHTTKQLINLPMIIYVHHNT